MPVNWQDKAVQDRLLTAVIASAGGVNVADIARLYGADMSYHAVENYLRKFRKAAKEMKNNDHVAAATTTTTTSAKPTTKKTTDAAASPAKAGVRSGRVAKKAGSKAKVKTEVFEEDVCGPARGENGNCDFEQDMDQDEV